MVESKERLNIYVMKKILFVCQYFYPETFRGNDVAFHLAEKGHDVHVITGYPTIPLGSFPRDMDFSRKGMKWFVG